MKTERCTERVWQSLRWATERCPNPGKYASGKCGIHDPQKIKERAERRGPCQATRDARARNAERKRVETLEAEHKSLLAFAVELFGRYDASISGDIDPSHFYDAAKNNGVLPILGRPDDD